MGIQRLKRSILVGEISENGIIKDVLQRIEVDEEGTKEAEVELLRIGDDGRVITDPKELVRDAFGSLVHLESIRECKRCGCLVASHNFSPATGTCRNCTIPQLVQNGTITAAKFTFKGLYKIIKTIAERGYNGCL